MCFAPQRCALFRHLNFQKCSETASTFCFQMCFAPQRRTLSTSQRPKVLRDRQFLTLFTSKCASRHNAVHFFVISTSKTAPNPSVFNACYFQMCLAPQRHALFRHLNFQKWSGAEVFCTFSLRNRLRATTACNFSSLISPDVSAPATYFSTLRSHKTTKKHNVSGLSYLFARLHLLSSDLFSSDSSPC